jgi:hypothetical protein
MSESIYHLKKPYGWEIAFILHSDAITRKRLEKIIPYENMTDSEMNEILDPSNNVCESDVFVKSTIEDPLDNDYDVYTLNLELLDSEQLDKIEQQAANRIASNIGKSGSREVSINGIDIKSKNYEELSGELSAQQAADYLLKRAYKIYEDGNSTHIDNVYDESRSNVAEQRGDDTMSPYSWDK